MRTILLAMCVGLSACAPRVLYMAERISHFEATYDETPGDSMAPAFYDLHRRLTDWGVTIGDLPPEAPYAGIAYGQHKTILLKPRMSINAKFEVLAHEAGHLLQPPAIEAGSQVGQLFAELVGVEVQKFYGSTTAEKVAAPYLAQMKYAFPAWRWMKRDIAYAVKALTGQIPLPAWRDEL
jgi:hypothetical protein